MGWLCLHFIHIEVFYRPKLARPQSSQHSSRWCLPLCVLAQSQANSSGSIQAYLISPYFIFIFSLFSSEICSVTSPLRTSSIVKSCLRMSSMSARHYSTLMIALLGTIIGLVVTGLCSHPSSLLIAKLFAPKLGLSSMLKIRRGLMYLLTL